MNRGNMNNPQQPAPRPTTTTTNHSRRRFLRGVGAAIALPAFESLLRGNSALAAEAAINPLTGAPVAATAAGTPMRMAFVYVPNGAIPANWWPTAVTDERTFQLAKTMQPLEAVRQHVQILAGVDQVNAISGKDGAGDHARASGTFLTSVRVKKTAGASIHAGVSIDQLVAGQVGHLTRFPSLELTCDSVRKSGNCDSGYSCAYQYNLSWQSPTTPVAPEPNPRLVFERLFGAGLPGQRNASLKLRQQQQKSILDFV